MASTARTLPGRDSEIDVLRGLLAQAQAGRSGALVLRGEPGIGKTALLEFAVGLADGFRVLRARGVESESEIAFAGLQELFGSVVDLLGRLPERQRAVLAGALALAPPVPGDPLAVRAATLSLLATAAESAPLLVIVDDAQWLDSPSAEALGFAARRLDSEGVLALFAIRDVESGAFDPTGIEDLAVAGLADEPALEVLTGPSERSIAPAVAARLVEAAGGNPLALQELPAILTDAQLEGREALQEPLAVGRGLERAFASRLERLPAHTRRSLVVAAAGANDDAATILAAITTSRLDRAAFEPAERAGLLAVGEGAIRFRHPLLRSVAYYAAPGEERRSAHAALAAASSDPARRAWHLAAAATGPDESVARALERAAEQAAARGAPASAARAYERAAALSPAEPPQAARLLAAATHAYMCGKPGLARQLADAGLSRQASPTVRAELDHLAALLERDQGSALQASRRLWEIADLISADDPLRATSMMLDASVADEMTGDTAAAVASGYRAVALSQACSPPVQLLARAMLAMTAIVRGEVRADELDFETTLAAIGSAAELPPRLVVAAELRVVSRLVQVGASVLPGRAAELDRRIAIRRREGSLALLPFLLGYGAQLDFREDRWARATARANEAGELARATGQRNFRSWALINQAWIEAARGAESECRAHATEALTLARALDVGALEVFIASLLGLLELGLGNVAAAVDALEECARLADRFGLGHPEVVPYEADLIEARHAAGRTQDAVDATELLQQRGERVGSPWALATAARCRGLLASDFEREFEAALALHIQAPGEFERARTQLCYGERLRRANRRDDAREQLTAALAVFDKLQARPWSERARRDLGAAGAGARARHDPAVADRLTPQELRVSLIIADGATVREAAEQLFLSPKTIEAHLGRAYRKLGVRNRAQLANTLTRAG